MLRIHPITMEEPKKDDVAQKFLPKGLKTKLVVSHSWIKALQKFEKMDAD